MPNFCRKGKAGSSARMKNIYPLVYSLLFSPLFLTLPDVTSMVSAYECQLRNPSTVPLYGMREEPTKSCAARFASISKRGLTKQAHEIKTKVSERGHIEMKTASSTQIQNCGAPHDVQ